MKKITYLLLAALALLGLAGCKNESGEKGAGCTDKQSTVVKKYTDSTTGHLMLAVECTVGDIGTRWYVSWDDPEGDQAEYDRYAVGDKYP